MEYLCVCNLESDDLIIVDSVKGEVVDRINLRGNLERVGPHSLCSHGGKIYTANSYSRGISIIDMNTRRVEHVDFGVSCTDIALFENRIYVLCGESNNILISSPDDFSVQEIVPCGNLPHSMCIDRNRRRIITCNLYEDSINIISMDAYENSHHIKVGAFPMSVTYTLEDEFILVCESNLGMEFNGALCMISAYSNKIVDRIALGKVPMNMFYDGERCYISNFAEGTVSIVDIQKRSVIGEYNIGGMPRGIIGDDRNIYVCDSYNNCLISLEKESGYKKRIFTGKEPMKIVRLLTL